MTTPKLLLHSHPVSSNALKARFLLAVLGLEYETRHVPFDRPRPEWHTRANPFGGIPTLRDGDLVVAESNAILRYLAAREGRDDLYPRDTARRSRVEWAMDAWATGVRPALLPAERLGLVETGDWDHEGGGHWEDAADQDALKAAVQSAGEALDLFERFCADDGTVCGGFTIADCCVGPVLWRWKRLPADFDRWPKLAKVQEAVSESPAFQAAGPVG